jgi:hypothetical protein
MNDTLTQQVEQGDIPEGWRPQEGSVVVGRLLSSTLGWSDESQSHYPILVIHDEKQDKSVAIHAFHAALQQRLAALAPKNGERVAIKMGPKVPLKSNPSRSVQTYTVKVEGRDESVDWSQFKRDRGGVPTPEQEEIPDLSSAGDDDTPF